MWGKKILIEPDRPHTTILRTRVAGRVPKAANTHSVYVTLAFPVQQWFNERASMLGCSNSALPCCLCCLRDDVLRNAAVNKVSGEMQAARTKRKTCISAKTPVCMHLFCKRL